MLKIFLKTSLRIVEYLILIGLSIGMYHYCAKLYSRFNDFPVDYHPDEWTKASQIQNNERNYNHPQLMLEVAQYYIEQDKVPMDQYDLVVSGRTTSAKMAALAAVLMAWGGWFSGRWIGFIAIAMGAGWCPSLLAHAHYFKEEPSLCLGIACVVAVAGAMSARPHWIIMLVLALLMGGACGVAASGKYAGVAMAGPGVLMILFATLDRRHWFSLPICLVLFMVGAYYSWTSINWRAVEDWANFWSNFLQEKNHAFTEHAGVTMNKPNGFFIDAAWTDAMPHIKLLAILSPIALLTISAKRFSRWLKPDPNAKPSYRPPVLFGWWLIITLSLVALQISFSAIPFFRYCLPIIFLLNVLAAASIVWIYHALPRPLWMKLSITLIALITLGWTQWLRCQDFTYQFAHDSHDELPKWIAENLKGNPRIAVDGYTALNSSDISRYSSAPAMVVRPRFVAEMGSIQQLRNAGYQYIITAGTSADRWTSPYTKKPEYDSDYFDEKREFYNDLAANYPVIHAWRAHYPMNTFTNPEIVIYRIDEGPKK